MSNVRRKEVRQMLITTCYTVPIRSQMYETSSDEKTVLRPGKVSDSLMKQTSCLCLDALKFCADVFLKEWAYLSSLPTGQKKNVISRKRGADLLIHSTKDNKAKYPDFDTRFPYMPAYVRRAVIADALGLASSYRSNHENWEKRNPSDRGAEPAIGFPDRYELTFYEQERDISGLEDGVIGLKLYDGKTWSWYSFRVSPSDARYIAKMRETRKMLSPVVEKVKGRYRIRFSFEEKRELVQNANPLAYTILSVDLGINAAASWCVMSPDGTVHAKGIIRLACDEDRLKHLMNRKKMYQQAGKKSHSVYRMLTDANRKLSIDTCREIMNTAVLYDVDCVVFEHLDRNGPARGKSCRERIHMWRAIDIQKRVELQAHRNGMRISRVCAWGTSKLAFDGSGPVLRGKDAGFHKTVSAASGTGRFITATFPLRRTSGRDTSSVNTGSSPDVLNCPKRHNAHTRPCSNCLEVYPRKAVYQ